MDIALNHTHQRNVYAQLTDDRVIETSVSEYFENRIQFCDWFRTVAGVRGDFFTAAVTDKLGGLNGGTSSSFLASPKLQMIFGPWFNTEFYLDGGFGFHSNDARGTTAVENPAAEGGGPAAKVPLLVQQRGAEVGVRSTVIPHLQTTFALWYWLQIANWFLTETPEILCLHPLRSAMESNLATIIRHIGGSL